METIVFHHILELGSYRYLGIFLLMAFEGDITLFTSAFLLSLSLLAPGPLLAALFGGTLVGDLGWFLLGKRFGKKEWSLVHFINRVTGRFDDHLKDKPMRTLVLSKFAYGLNHFIFFRAGTFVRKRLRFFEQDVFATMLWMLIVGGLGYLSGASFSHIRHYFRYGEVAFLGAIIIFLFFSHQVSKTTKKRL